MKTVHVSAASGSYGVLIGRGILDDVGTRARESAGGSRALVLSDDNVFALYGDRAVSSLEGAGYEVASHVVPAGERSKSMATLAEVLERMAACGLTRDDVVVALGGGVIGDLGGFAAAVYMRGCKVVQVPTSLLAMVDSSVGGKTAVDLSAGKNLAGAFFQPRVVLADLDCLATIDHDLLTDSCGEVIKYGVMSDATLFSDLEREPINAEPLDYERLERIVGRCVEIKRNVVDADEREGGLRQILNLGHTIGHAVESSSDYQMGHGSCVAVGLCAMARACCRLGACDADTAQRIVATVAAHGLPTSTEVPTAELFSHALSDKKRHADSINVVEVLGIGSVAVRRVGLGDLRHMIELGAAGHVD